MNFLENVIYGCQINLNQAQLQQFCSSTALHSFDIFSNLDFVDYFGQFGNANYYFQKVSIFNLTFCRTGFQLYKMTFSSKTGDKPANKIKMEMDV